MSSTMIGSSGDGGGCGVSSTGCCIFLTRVRRPVTGNALPYFSMTWLYNLKGFPELIVFLLLDANATTVFNAVFIFIIFRSSYNLITSCIFSAFSPVAFLRYDFRPVMLLRICIAANE